MIQFLLYIICFTFNASSQTYREIYKHKSNLMYSAGISTQQVLFNHPAANSMYFDNDKDFTEGGSFDGAQSGFDLRVMYIMPNNEKLYFSTGLEYTFFSSKEQYAISNTSVTNYSHKINLLSPYIGAYYRILRVPLANTNIYIGPELKFNYIHNGQFQYNVENMQDNEKSQIIDKYYKGNTFRLGGLLRIGAEGEISEQIGANISVGLHWVNMLGRDNSYGELLTISRNEKTEINLFMINFNISIFYRE